jgi:hypothetical protein
MRSVQDRDEFAESLIGVIPAEILVVYSGSGVSFSCVETVLSDWSEVPVGFPPRVALADVCSCPDVAASVKG